MGVGASPDFVANQRAALDDEEHVRKKCKEALDSAMRIVEDAIPAPVLFQRLDTQASESDDAGIAVLCAVYLFRDQTQSAEEAAVWFWSESNTKAEILSLRLINRSLDAQISPVDVLMDFVWQSQQPAGSGGMKDGTAPPSATSSSTLPTSSSTFISANSLSTPSAISSASSSAGSSAGSSKGSEASVQTRKKTFTTLAPASMPKKQLPKEQKKTMLELASPAQQPTHSTSPIVISDAAETSGPAPTLAVEPAPMMVRPQGRSVARKFAFGGYVFDSDSDSRPKCAPPPKSPPPPKSTHPPHDSATNVSGNERTATALGPKNKAERQMGMPGLPVDSIFAEELGSNE